MLCEEVVCVWLKHFTLSALSFQTAGTVESLFNSSVQSNVPGGKVFALLSKHLENWQNAGIKDRCVPLFHGLVGLLQKLLFSLGGRG